MVTNDRRVHTPWKACQDKSTLYTEKKKDICLYLSISLLNISRRKEPLNPPWLYTLTVSVMNDDEIKKVCALI